MLFGTLEHAQKLGLTLVDVSHKRIPIEGAGYRSTVTEEAQDVRVSAHGREECGSFTVLQQNSVCSIMPILGMEFLFGSIIQFNEDETVDWIFPKENSRQKLRRIERLHSVPEKGHVVPEEDSQDLVETSGTSEEESSHAVMICHMAVLICLLAKATMSILAQ